jgi:hypothetical protein
MVWLLVLTIMWILSLTGNVGGNTWYWGALVLTTPVVILLAWRDYRKPERGEDER